MNEENQKEELKKLNVWVTKHQKEFLKTKANIESTSISSIARQCIDMYINVETLNTNIDKICEIIDIQIERSFKKI